MQVKKNIKEKIGVEHEILFTDNSKTNQGICAVYNNLALQAKFSYLCFVHEDVLFQTSNWGQKIIKTFSEDAAVGLIGIAGCKYKSSYFSGWFSNTKQLDCANYIHQYKQGIETVHLSPSDNNSLQEVVCIDGVFMCASKNAWNDNRFNEKFLNGFHFYDIDFSLRIAHSYKVIVTFDVLLTHITEGGNYGNEWAKIAMHWHKMAGKNLPFSKIEVNRGLADKNIINATFDFLKNYNISFLNKVKWIVLQKIYLLPSCYYSLMKFIFYRPLRLKYLYKLFRQK